MRAQTSATERSMTAVSWNVAARMSAPERVDRSLLPVVEPDLGDAVVVAEPEQVDGVVHERSAPVAVGGHPHVGADVLLAVEHLDEFDLLAIVGGLAGALQEIAYASKAVVIT